MRQKVGASGRVTKPRSNAFAKNEPSGALGLRKVVAVATLFCGGRGVKSANARFTPKIGMPKTGVKSANERFTPVSD